MEAVRFPSTAGQSVSPQRMFCVSRQSLYFLFAWRHAESSSCISIRPCTLVQRRSKWFILAKEIQPKCGSWPRTHAAVTAIHSHCGFPNGLSSARVVWPRYLSVLWGLLLFETVSKQVAYVSPSPSIKLSISFNNGADLFLGPNFRNLLLCKPATA